MRTRNYDWIALTAIIVGAVNWGLIGFFQFDLLSALFGGVSGAISRTIYAIVGIAGLYCLSLYSRVRDEDREFIEARD